ncbi:MAG: alpha/beta fold hydrolase [Rhodocyclaceae bacterium]|nr:alpha/beta fold hydrolase [Rhodocyclaceae bacterium]
MRRRSCTEDVSTTPYRAPRWLVGGNAQTLWPLLRKGPLPAYRRERHATPDGDFIDIDWIDAVPGASPATPQLILFHGLEGSSRSHYARALMRAVARRGWRGAVVHFRGCSGEPNRLPRAYHSGDSAEIDWVLRRLSAAQPLAPLYVAGVSLGANALLKWLGEQGAVARFVTAAAAISAPHDLAAANVALMQGFNRIYTRHFLRTLIPAALAKLDRFPGLFDAARVRAANSMYAFDDVVTAPLHGFAGAADYYARASAGQFLGGIAVPTLVLNAKNDPFLPTAALPGLSRISAAVTLEQPDAGGHVGFVVDRFPGALDWLPQRLLAHFDAHATMPSASDRR